MEECGNGVILQQHRFRAGTNFAIRVRTNGPDLRAVCREPGFLAGWLHVREWTGGFFPLWHAQE